jgi:hypothetical protein
MRHEAIYATHPTVVTVDDTAGAFDANGNQVVLDESLVSAKQAELEAAYTAKAYQRSRAAEYPPLAEQLDYIYHNGVEAWKTDIIDPIKQRYPKP